MPFSLLNFIFHSFVFRDKKQNYRKRVQERIQRREKMENFRSVSELQQRFTAISTSVNKYDWANKQQGDLEHNRGVVEQIQYSKATANAISNDRHRKKVLDIQAANQLEIRRAHEAIDAYEELDLEMSRKRVEKVKKDRPERYPPKLPGPSSLPIDGIAHAAYNPVQRGSIDIKSAGQSKRNTIPRQDLVDIRERWKVLATVPEGRIGLHPITAEIT